MEEGTDAAVVRRAVHSLHGWELNVGVRAYKVLHEGRSLFTGSPWPLPAAGQAGDWVEAGGPPALCVRGIHAASTEQLPHWLGMDLWEVELGGEILEHEAALVASRARPVRRVEA